MRKTLFSSNSATLYVIIEPKKIISEVKYNGQNQNWYCRLW